LRGVLFAWEPVAAVIVTRGWRERRRINSWPAKPVAPATATRINFFWARWSPSVSVTTCMFIAVSQVAPRPLDAIAFRKTMRPEE
jgi:hypothetical protein